MKKIKLDKPTPREKKLRKAWRDLDFSQLLENAGLTEKQIDFNEVKKWADELDKSLAPKRKKRKNGSKKMG